MALVTEKQSYTLLRKKLFIINKPKILKLYKKKEKVIDIIGGISEIDLQGRKGPHNLRHTSLDKY